MKRIIILFFTLILCTVSKAQWQTDYGFSIGISNYLGDIGGKEKTRRDFLADLKFAKTRWNVGGFYRHKLSQKFFVKIAADYLRIEGDDKLSTNPARNARNLNFRNDMVEVSGTFQFLIFEDNDLGNTYRYKNGFRAFVFAGLGGFYSNPKALYKGSYVPLRPLKTEGVTYSPLGINIPVGIGFYFTMSKKHRIGFDVNYRFTFTDYLDDISGNYPDSASISGNPALSYRTPELGKPANKQEASVYHSHGWGQKRGDKTHNDGYITMNLSYSYVLRGKSSFYKSKYRRGGGGGGRSRKIRAKF